jgi:protein-tyrosine-phosphatase
MAAEFAKAFLDMKGITDSVHVCSRSLSVDYEPPNSPPNDMAVAVLSSEYGLDHSKHRSKLIDREDVEKADWIIGVTSHHVEAVQQAFPQHAAKVLALEENVPDPWRGPREDYLACAQQLKPLVESKIALLLKPCVRGAINS